MSADEGSDMAWLSGLGCNTPIDSAGILAGRAWSPSP